MIVTMKAAVTPVALAGNNLIELSLLVDEVICPEVLDPPVLQDIRLFVQDSGLYVRHYEANGPYPANWSSAGRVTITIELEDPT